VVHRYMGAQRTILTTDEQATINNDHILCFKQPGEELNCSYEAVLLETRTPADDLPRAALYSDRQVGVAPKRVP
jgi:hypothetical protein